VDLVAQRLAVQGRLAQEAEAQETATREMVARGLALQESVPGELAARESAAQESAVLEPAAQESVALEPVAQESVALEPVAQESVALELAEVRAAESAQQLARERFPAELAPAPAEYSAAAMSPALPSRIRPRFRNLKKPICKACCDCSCNSAKHSRQKHPSKIRKCGSSACRPCLPTRRSRCDRRSPA
jgi:hypothetical protein